MRLVQGELKSIEKPLIDAGLMPDDWKSLSVVADKALMETVHDRILFI